MVTRLGFNIVAYHKLNVYTSPLRLAVKDYEIFGTHTESVFAQDKDGDRGSSWVAVDEPIPQIYV